MKGIMVTVNARQKMEHHIDRMGKHNAAVKLVKQRAEIRKLRRSLYKQTDNVLAMRHKILDLKGRLNAAVFMLELMAQHCADLEKQLDSQG